MPQTTPSLSLKLARDEEDYEAAQQLQEKQDALQDALQQVRQPFCPPFLPHLFWRAQTTIALVLEA